MLGWGGEDGGISLINWELARGLGVHAKGINFGAHGAESTHTIYTHTRHGAYFGFFIGFSSFFLSFNSCLFRIFFFSFFFFFFLVGVHERKKSVSSSNTPAGERLHIRRKRYLWPCFASKGATNAHCCSRVFEGNMLRKENMSS